MKPFYLLDQQIQNLQRFSLFEQLDGQKIQSLCQGLELKQLNQGSLLFSQGEASHAMTLLISGKVEIFQSTKDASHYTLATIDSPNIIGELAYFTGSTRNASARALQDCDYFEISAGFLLEAAQEHPRGLESFLAEISQRLIHNAMHTRIQSALGIHDSQLLKQLIAETQVLTISKGECLMRQNDPADTMAVLLEGRLLVQRITSAGAIQFLSRIYPGEPVGETGLLSTQRRRNAEVRAQRDSKVAVINLEKFEALLMNRPEVLLTLIRTIIDRTTPKVSSPKNQTLEPDSIQLHHKPSIALLCNDQKTLTSLTDMLQSDPTVSLVDATRLDQQFLQTDMSSKALKTPLDTLVKSWLDEEERKNKQLILLADSSKPRWTQFVQSYCDASYIFSNHFGTSSISVGNQPHTLRIIEHRKGNATDQVVLPPRIDTSNPRDLQSLHRLIGGKGRGLVLSGGGARGFAHIGVLRALEEAGLSPDSLGGTSMGALVAATYALYRDLDIVTEITTQFSNPRKILDWTLPISSLTASKKVRKVLKAILGDHQFSELSIPLFLIASDIQNHQEVRFTSGPLYDAVRASISIPGIFYPVIRPGQTLVDGGVMNNLPVDSMRERIGKGIVIASDLTNHLYTNKKENLQRYYQPNGDGINGFAQLFRRSFSKAPHLKPPGLGDIIMKTFEVNTQKRILNSNQPWDKLISIDVSDFDPLDFGAAKSIIQEGYKQAVQQLSP